MFKVDRMMGNSALDNLKSRPFTSSKENPEELPKDEVIHALEDENRNLRAELEAMKKRAEIKAPPQLRRNRRSACRKRLSWIEAYSAKECARIAFNDERGAA